MERFGVGRHQHGLVANAGSEDNRNAGDAQAIQMKI
jgi:hypothetical protein